MRVLAALLLCTVTLAGCQDAPAPDPPRPFDGDGAYAFVESIVHNGSALRDRVPGSPGHPDTAQWLHDTAEAAGWTTRLDGFGGSDVEAIGYGAAGFYRERASLCSSADRERASSLMFYNIVANWDSPSNDTLLLAAHWDAKRHASEDPVDPDAVVPAANDGASGVGVLLQLIDHVAAGELVPTTDLEIVFFDGEDGFEDCHPLAGSTFHAHHLAIDPDSFRMVLLDMVGDADARFAREPTGEATDPAFAERVWSHLADASLDADDEARLPVDSGCPVFDDHRPFVERGYVAMDIIDFRRDGTCRFPPYWHTTADTMDNISPDALGHVGRGLWRLVEDPTVFDAA